MFICYVSICANAPLPDQKTLQKLKLNKQLTLCQQNHHLKDFYIIIFLSFYDDDYFFNPRKVIMDKICVT